MLAMKSQPTLLTVSDRQSAPKKRRPQPYKTNQLMKGEKKSVLDTLLW